MNKTIKESECAEVTQIPDRKPIPVRFFCCLTILIWTLAVGASLIYNVHVVNKHAVDLAIYQAKAAFQKDVMYRHWNSIFNGVYVLVENGNIEPNPYLPKRGRNIYLPDGRMLTKINPAFMTRLVHELGESKSGVIGHITSNNPLRPMNAPDEWEAESLRQIESGAVQEVSAVKVINGKEYMRYIAGLETEESCLACHAFQGYKVGDIRGGISVGIPMERFSSTALMQKLQLVGTHLSLWLLGLVGIGFGTRSLNSRLRERDSAEQGLRKLTAELESRVAERTEDLKRRQGELNAIVDNADAGVFLKDGGGIYLVANAKFADIVDRPVERIIGKTNADLFSPTTEHLLTEHEQFVVAMRQAAELKSVLVSKKGVRYSCFTFPVMEHDSVVGLGGLLVDMTERDKTEQVLREARDAAEQANRAKTDFLANVSHEIRTPLNGLIGMSDLLMRTRLSADQASMVTAIKSSGDALLAVLNDILDLSKITAGKLILENVPFSLRDMLHGAIKSFTSIAYKKQLELILHISPKVPDQIIGDSIRLRQVILNLVSNALKFTENGEVVVTVLAVSGSDGTTRLRFSVRDTGIGIPLSKQDKITRPFEQVDASTTRKYGGTGLGLAICAKLLELMHSRLELESFEGLGSRFWFEIEVPVSAENVAAKPLVSMQALLGRRALVVDDNDTNLLVLSEMLAQWGIEAIKASSMEQAFDLALEAAGAGERFDLVLSDYQMPDHDGADLLRCFRAEPPLADIPVILLTSGDVSREIYDSIGTPSGFSSVLDKPILSDMLIRAIAVALELWESYETNEAPEAENEEHKPAVPPQNILLAEDVEMNQMVAVRMLKELGHHVTVVPDGKQALGKVCQERFDLVLMDVQMPVMDGVQATQAIRDLEKRGIIPDHVTIVAMTANALKGDRSKYLAAGMDGYLSKPILLDELRSAIEEFCLKRSENTSAQDGADADGADVGQDVEAANVPDSARDEAEDQRGTSAGEAAAASSVTALPQRGLIDRAMLEHNFGDNKTFIGNSMKIFLRDAPDLLQKIVRAVKENDDGGLIESAHALKGIVSYFNREAVYRHCLELEQMGRRAALADCQAEARQRSESLGSMLESMYGEMRRYLEDSSNNSHEV